MKPYNYKSLKAFVYDQLMDNYLNCLNCSNIDRLDYKGWCEISDILIHEWLINNKHNHVSRVTMHNLTAKVVRMLEQDGLVIKTVVTRNVYLGHNYKTRRWINNMVLYKIATPTDIAERKLKRT